VTGYPSFPELKPEEQNFRSRDDIAPYIEPIKGTSFKYFSALANELGIYIQYGLATGESKSGPYHNSAVVVGPSGKLEAYHHKIGLFEMEHDYLVPGTQGAIFNSPVGRVGLMICADTYEPRVLRQFSGRTDVIFLSTSWARYNSGMSQFKSTARQLGSYLLAANHMYYPDSGVINPDGSTQSHIRQSYGIAYGYLPRLK
jgi:predicted amidohydrolase